MSAQETMNTTTKKAANSIVGKLTALILAGAAAVLLGGAPATAQNASGAVLVIGDSLQVGTGPYLEQQLGALSVESDDRQSRRSDEGLQALRARLRPDHAVVVFDMGTNDDPSNPDALYANLQAARAVTGDRCLVVATVVRPAYNGFTVEGMNAAVERFALENPGVQLVDWHGVATSTPGILYDDGVHARPEGYALRGRLIADAVRSCGGAGGTNVTGIPAPSRKARNAPPAAPRPAPEPPAEVEVDIEPPATLVAIAGAVRHAATLVSAAGRDARQAAGMGPPEPVLGAD
jgi:lysophospholipase L1-like esterase